MRELVIDYTTWKSVVQANSFAVYFRAESFKPGRAWAGTNAFVYEVSLTADVLADFQTSFPSPTAVASKDEAIARIVGLTNVRQEQYAPDGRLVVRHTVAGNGKQRLRAFTFYSSDPTKLVNRDYAWTDLADVTQKEYDTNKDDITSAPYTASVKTVIDFEPTYNYEIIGGEVDIPGDLHEGTTDAWYAACVGVPDIPAAQGGSIPFVSAVNLEAFSGLLDIDGRATTFLTYNATYHTNKIRFVFYHPAGASKRFQIFVETFA